MSFVSSHGLKQAERPLFVSILANTQLSTIPGISGAGPTPEKTLLTPILDAELIARGEITSMPVRPDTPTGCPTPATITRAVMELIGITPFFINAGLVRSPVVPCFDVYGSPGDDPRVRNAVPDAAGLYEKGKMLGNFLSAYTDLIVLGECVPGGTTTALCVLRALGYPARVSSSFVSNPVGIKEEVWRMVQARAGPFQEMEPLDVLKVTGDPMMPVAAGLASGYSGKLVLAGGTQMLAVAGVLKAMGRHPPDIATTCYVRDDPSADVEETARAIGVRMYVVDPGFGSLGHSGLARYCSGEVKEGMGAGGAMFLASLQGYSHDEIRQHIFEAVSRYQ
ncbi:MAG TPA: TIGR00303 family protein [Methanoregulaceae archaeon]|nr:TIGR00303 family protein [Methanoregulaceae archaeon]